MNNQPTKQSICIECGVTFTSKLVFGQWVKRCDNCKTPFNTSLYNFKKQQDARRSRAIKEHDLIACMAKNTVCTCFDW